jgi:hypothetical protein
MEGGAAPDGTTSESRRGRIRGRPAAARVFASFSARERDKGFNVFVEGQAGP